MNYKSYEKFLTKHYQLILIVLLLGVTIVSIYNDSVIDQRQDNSIKRVKVLEKQLYDLTVSYNGLTVTHKKDADLLVSTINSLILVGDYIDSNAASNLASINELTQVHNDLVKEYEVLLGRVNSIEKGGKNEVLLRISNVVALGDKLNKHSDDIKEIQSFLNMD